MTEIRIPLHRRANLVYGTLDFSSAIRVLELYPGEDDEHIRCHLHVTQIGSSDFSYHGVSYTWGDVNQQALIECNKRAAYVPKTLHSILVRLRRLFKVWPVYLWVDALCINQSRDVNALRERARQVENMNEIFSGAQGVIVDLGEADENLEDFSKFLRKFERAPLSLDHFNDDNFDRRKYVAKLGLDLPGIEQTHGWTLLAKFMLRPYFRRVWIIQEYALAKTVLILVGEYPVNSGFIEIIMKAAEHLLTLPESSLLSASPDMGIVLILIKKYYSNIKRITLARRRDAKDQLGFFMFLILNRWLFEATDPRDRIFALRGFMAIEKSEIYVDYIEDVDEVGRRAYLYFLDNLMYGVRALYQYRGEASSTTSWATDLWRHGDRELLNDAFDADGNHDYFNAGGYKSFLPEAKTSDWIKVLKEDNIFRARVTDNGKILSIDGVNIGSVETLAIGVNESVVGRAAFGYPKEIMKDRDGWLTGTVKWMEEMVQARKESKDVSLTDLCRTLMADILYGQRIKDEEAFQNVLAAFAQSGYYANKDPNGPWAIYLDRKCNRDRDFDRFLNSLDHQRRLSIITNGVPCLVPDDTEVGDLIVIFTGTPLPFVLRKREHHQYRIVGSCYVHGFMDGQAMEKADPDVREFEVV